MSTCMSPGGERWIGKMILYTKVYRDWWNRVRPITDDKILHVFEYKHDIDLDNHPLGGVVKNVKDAHKAAPIIKEIAKPVVKYTTGIDMDDYDPRHSFIVFRTTRWYWSFEKNSNRVAIQRGLHLDDVTREYRGSARKKVETLVQIKHYEGTGTINDVIKMIHRKNELSKPYAVDKKSNCHNFSQLVFDFSTFSKQ